MDLLLRTAALHLCRPVAGYWPEFAAQGKEDIEVRHVLAHTSGLSAWQQPLTMEDLHAGTSTTLSTRRVETPAPRQGAPCGTSRPLALRASAAPGPVTAPTRSSPRFISPRVRRPRPGWRPPQRVRAARTGHWSAPDPSSLRIAAEVSTPSSCSTWRMRVTST
ncbi:serine hydrolase [Streptomyces sp. NPDC050703]|uniref:serine hydrolase n=1 Tax=Streptomyces sp. NPDC050703 TaxID=3157218 RepID=UPI0034391C97